MAMLASELDAVGIANRTLASQGKRMLIYVVDLKNETRDKVLMASRRLRARLVAIGGKGELIGDENDRDKARAIFEQEIKRYEATHPSLRSNCPKPQNNH